MGHVRKNNEDNYFVNGQYRFDVDQDETPIATIIDKKVILAAVFDGMGGEENGELASLHAAKTLTKYDEASFGAITEAYVRQANDKICEEMDAQASGRMGTTLALLQIKNKQLNICNLGDSPIFFYRDGNMEQISVDHNEAQRMIDMGLITKEDYENGDKKYRLTQHLGIYPDEMELSPSVKVDIELKKKDVILACSDGLTDMVKNAEIQEIIAKNLSLEEKTKQLRDLALERGGKDNITLVLVEVLGGLF